jgi:cell division septation protein DedD
VTHTDDSFHEIQLNGKQLVFLFMAATVVSVVIFLCGVLVGRGVRAERLAAAAQTEALAEPTADLAASSTTPEPPPPSADVTKAEAPPTADELSYPKQLEKSTTEVGDIRPDSKLPKPAPEIKPVQTAATGAAAAAVAVKEAAPQPLAPAPKPAAAVEKKTAKPAPAAAPASSTSTAGTGTDGNGFAVQVAALNVRSEADAIAKRLAAKGYAAYVQVPNGGASVYRVRIGTFKTRKEAESVASRLQKEEQVKPWVTR